MSNDTRNDLKELAVRMTAGLEELILEIARAVQRGPRDDWTGSQLEIDAWRLKATDNLKRYAEDAGSKLDQALEGEPKKLMYAAQRIGGLAKHMDNLPWGWLPPESKDAIENRMDTVIDAADAVARAAWEAP
jgi:hypothetical protein